MEEKNNEFFNEEKRDKTLERLDKKWPRERRCCEVCEKESWTLAQDQKIIGIAKALKCSAKDLMP